MTRTTLVRRLAPVALAALLAAAASACEAGGGGESGCAVDEECPFGFTCDRVAGTCFPGTAADVRGGDDGATGRDASGDGGGRVEVHGGDTAGEAAFAGGDFQLTIIDVDDQCLDGGLAILFQPEGLDVPYDLARTTEIPAWDDLPATFTMPLQAPFSDMEVTLEAAGPGRMSLSGAIQTNVLVDADNYGDCHVDVLIDAEIVIVDDDTLAVTATLEVSDWTSTGDTCPAVSADPCPITLELRGRRLTSEPGVSEDPGTVSDDVVALSGMVYDMETQAPIAGALVMTEPAIGQLRTNGQGMYVFTVDTFPALTVGTPYRITASMVGYIQNFAQVTADTRHQRNIDIPLQRGAPEFAIRLSRTSLVFGDADFFPGETTASQQINLLLEGAGDLELPYEVHVPPAAAAWLSAAPATGTLGPTPTFLTITVDKAGLAAGTYHGTVDILLEGGLATVSVTLTVGA